MSIPVTEFEQDRIADLRDREQYLKEEIARISIVVKSWKRSLLLVQQEIKQFDKSLEASDD